MGVFDIHAGLLGEYKQSARSCVTARDAGVRMTVGDAFADGCPWPMALTQPSPLSEPGPTSLGGPRVSADIAGAARGPEAGPVQLQNSPRVGRPGWLGSDATTSLEQRAGSVRVCIARSGERNSAAMRTMGVLALELAAMLCGCEGQGWHPGLLIHATAREADLSADIYRKFFLLAVDQIEAVYGDAEPGFQYIVTTTEPPPLRCQQPPWLINPVLDASTPEGRLFGMDL